MKLHLPVSLFKSILVGMGIACATVDASVVHQDATLITYADFGQNAGRYVVGSQVNALVDYIRSDEMEGGVWIHYTGGQPSYKLEHGMIDFGSGYYKSTAAAISPNCTATVKHNGAINADFTSQCAGIGSDNAILYKAIEVRGNGTFSTVVDPANPSTAENYYTDHKVTRLSKIVTDAPYVGLYDTAAKGISGQLFYHAGSGRYQSSDYSGNLTWQSGAYLNVIGGITGMEGYQGSQDGAWSVYQQFKYGADGISTSQPLPWISLGGDSGSPVYVWDEESSSFQYFGGTYGGDASNRYTVISTNTSFDESVVEGYHEYVDMSSCSTVYLNAVSNTGETITDGTSTTTLKYGQVSTDAAGQNVLLNAAGEKVEYNGVATGVNTWGNLNALKDTQNWYNYDQSYVQPSIEDLFFTEDLVFTSSAAENNIVLNDTVDLGVGYAEFNAGGEGKTVYFISSAEEENNQFNHAGYVINAGAEVHLQLTGSADHLFEWRKIGAGDLYIEGSGNNDVLLNIGGSGKTYLNREGGYAAYNVLVNTGATVVIKDVGQIARDLTFGNRGGTLDMNGNSMEWHTTTSSENRFSINALTEAALIANYSGSSTLTYKEAGDTTYVGSFADSAGSSLKIVYDAGSGSSWTLNSIRTNLQHADSGLEVQSGRVILSGTNTVHGTGSDMSTENDRYFNEDDWHYADAAMSVSVQEGGTFELGSHARLTGDVTVEEGGSYVMREAVRHQKEYVEGGQKLEDTSLYSDYFGHKGDVILNGGTFAVQFNDGVDANTSYSGRISGNGALTVDTGNDGGSLTLSGAISAEVTRTLTNGWLILTGDALADSSVKWQVEKAGVIVVDTTGDMLDYVDASSTGTLGLNRDYTTQVALGSHSGMGIGALAGSSVQYGAAGTEEKLNTATTLSGGGKILVNFVLSDSDALNIDGKGLSGGEVHLNRVADNFNGTVNVQSAGGKMILTTAEEGVFAAATVNINDGGVYRLADDQSSVGGTVNVNAGGLLQGKDMVVSGTVSLAGELDYSSFTVKDGGVLNMQSSGRLDADNSVTIAENGTMNLNGNTLSDKVNLENGGTMNGGGGTIGASAEVISTKGTGILSSGTGTLVVDGQIGAMEGAKLVLTGDSAILWTSSINRDGGTLEVQTANLKLGHNVTNGTQTIGGKLLIGADVTINANLDTYLRGKVTHNINELAISGGHTLTIKEHESTWAQTWNIAALTGEGNIVWDSSIYWPHQGTSKLRLQGSNSFTGTLEVKQSTGYGSMQHLSLEHDYAAQNITVKLTGDADSNPGMAVDTANARLAGLNGTTNTYVYAGAIMSSFPVYGQSSSNPAPSSSDLNTLTVTGNGSYTFEGNVIGDASNGLNIVMDGTGTQTFTNSANVLHDVIAKQGSLVFTNAPTIYGEMGVAQGATLQIGSGELSLDAGETLCVLMGTDGGTATLNNSLVINGGTLDFGAYNDDGVTASLALGAGCTISVGDTATLNLQFSNRGNIKVSDPVTYNLMGGDWSALSGQITVEDCVYLTAAVTADTNGLSATFSLKDGYEYWMSDDPSIWTPTKGNVVITGMSPYSDSIDLQADTSITHGILDNDTTIAISSETGNTLSFETLEKVANGDLEINAGVKADSFTLNDDTRISGTGTLTVGDLKINADLTTGMALDVTGGISIAENSSWTLDGTEREFRQNLTMEQVNNLSALSVWGKAAVAVDVASDATLSADISGTGAIDKNGAGMLTSTDTLEIGTLNVNAGGYKATGAVNIGTLNVAEGLTVTMWNEESTSGASKVLGTVALGEGATLATWDVSTAKAATHMDELLVKGTAATLKDSWNAGYYSIGSLNSSGNAATLNIVKISDSTISTVVNLGSETSAAGNFKGTIVLNSDTGQIGDSARSLFLILGSQQAAAGAVVNLAEADSSTAVLGLGINADSVTIAGLKSASGLADRARVFSGSVAADTQWATTDDASGKIVGDALRTLTIDASGDCEFNGSILGSLNLVKEGSGIQSLNGSSAAVEVTVNGGALKIGTAGTFSADTVNVNVNGGFDAQGAVEVGQMNVADGVTVTLYNANAASGASKKFDTVVLGNGAGLTTNDRAEVNTATTIGHVQLAGATATLSDSYNSGYMTVKRLSLAEGVTTATLNLNKAAASTKSTVFELGAAGEDCGNFVGTIALNQNNSGNSRSEFVVLSNGDIARNAVVSLAQSASNSAYIGLGVNAGLVTIAGLESTANDAGFARVFSGTIGKSVNWNANTAIPDTIGSETRTLTISTHAGREHNFYGQILGNLNLTIDGEGTQVLSGTSAAFNGSLTVNGGKLVLGSSAMGMLTSAGSVVVNEEGTLDLSAATIASGLLAPVSGRGTVILNYGVSGNGTGFNFSSFSGNVQINSGRVQMNTSTFGADAPDFTLTSGNSQLVFNGTGTKVGSNVYLQADTTFHVNSTKDGEITGTLSGKALSKAGAGKLILSGGVDISKLNADKGTFVVQGKDNTIGMIDASRDTGTVLVDENATLKVTGQVLVNKDSAYQFKSGAQFDIAADKVVIGNKGGETASLTASETVSGTEYSIDNAAYELRNGHLSYTGSEAGTLKNKLTNSSVENAGGGTLTVAGTGNSITGVVAGGGDMTVLNQAALSLDILEVAGGKTVGLYTGADVASERTAATVSGTAAFGSGAVLDAACLTLADGATLEIDNVAIGAVTLNGALTFGSGIKMGDKLLASVGALSYGETLNLFTGLSEVSLPAVAATESSRVLASSVFSNVQSENLYVEYHLVGDVGTLLVANVPEPATATLSLLALSALAARRRRKE